ncbi:MAG: VOC family protein [Pseudomonadota bacterium]|nr:VOC family protein [Pseudomonadota bacterium]
MKNVINWFEIPATDFERAVGFYEKVFDTTLTRESMDGAQMGIFPHKEPATGGAVTKMTTLEPGNSGTLIYLDAAPDVDPVLSRVKANGGQVTMGKTFICDEVGYIGVFIDSEGNRVGVHAPK